MSDLKPVKTVKPQDWMTAPETAAVMKALGKGQALFVGGCVRNMLAGEEIGDIDIATIWSPQEVTEKLQAAGIKVVPTGIDHGTITAVTNHKAFEVTTLRRDVETDGRRAVVAFTKDWLEDAQRRDFTMNTLLADQTGNIYDPTGQGVDDLAAGRVIFVGDPAMRIAEDYLRILRFFRFHALYGKGAPDKEALKACRAAAGKIETLSAQRITQEFFRILSVEQPADVVALMFAHDVLKEFVFAEYDSELLTHFCQFQIRYGLGPPSIPPPLRGGGDKGGGVFSDPGFVAPRLLVLAGLQPKNIATMNKLLLIPKVFKRDIEAISQVLALPDLKDGQAVKVAIYKYGRVPSAQALMIELAQDRVMNGYAPKALEIIQKWDIPNFPLSGDDLMKAGIKPGPELGQKLAEIEEWWIEQEFKPNKAACLKQLEK